MEPTRNEEVPVTLPVVELAEPAKPRVPLPAWARLLIYIPTAIGLGLVGNVAGSIVAIVSLMASGEAGQGVAIDLEAVMQSLPPWSIVLMLYCTFVPVAGLSLVFARLLDRRSWDEIGLAARHGTGRELLVGVLLGATVIAYTLLYLALGLVELDRTEHTVAASIAYGLVLFVGVGFWEETIFRGYVLPNLEQVVGRVSAVIGSSVLFWLVHLGTPEARHPLTALGLVLMGVLFAVCYYRTGSLWLPIALHASYDFFLVSLFQPHSQMSLPTVFEIETRAPEWLVGPPGKAGVLDLLYLVVLLAIVWALPVRRAAEDAADRAS